MSVWNKSWNKRAVMIRVAVALTVFLLAADSRLKAQDVVEGQERPELTEQQRQRLQELEQRFIERVSEALELDEAQTRQLTETLRSSRQERTDLLQRRATLRRELNRSIAEPNPDDARIQQLLDQRSALERRQVQVGQDEERRLGEFMSPVQKARFMYLRQRMAQAVRDRARQAGQQRPPQRPRRPGADRPQAADRAADRATDRGPRSDARAPARPRRVDGSARSAP